MTDNIYGTVSMSCTDSKCVNRYFTKEMNGNLPASLNKKCWSIVSQNTLSQRPSRNPSQNRASLQQKTPLVIQSFDFLKQYYGRQNNLKVIVRVVDVYDLPVIAAIVVLSLKREHHEYHQQKKTDHNGLAEFCFSNIESGVWSVTVHSVLHPEYQFSGSIPTERCRTITV